MKKIAGILNGKTLKENYKRDVSRVLMEEFDGFKFDNNLPDLGVGDLKREHNLKEWQISYLRYFLERLKDIDSI